MGGLRYWKVGGTAMSWVWLGHQIVARHHMSNDETGIFNLFNNQLRDGQCQTERSSNCDCRGMGSILPLHCSMDD